MHLWGAKIGNWSFVIGLDQIVNEGYRATWKSSEEAAQPFEMMAHEIEGSPFKTFIDAESACRRQYLRLRQ